MDDFRFDIISDRGLEHVMKVALLYQHKVTHWWTDERNGKPRLVLGWTAPDPSVGAHPLKSAIEADEAVELVIGWLKAQDYGPEPVTDGHNRKGWRVYNEALGRAGGCWQGTTCIEPYWCEYSK